MPRLVSILRTAALLTAILAALSGALPADSAPAPARFRVIAVPQNTSAGYWVFEPDGTLRGYRDLAALEGRKPAWQGRWTAEAAGYRCTMQYQGAGSTFLVRMSPDGASFEAFESDASGQSRKFRVGLRLGDNREASTPPPPVTVSGGVYEAAAGGATVLSAEPGTTLRPVAGQGPPAFEVRTRTRTAGPLVVSLPLAPGPWDPAAAPAVQERDPATGAWRPVTGLSWVDRERGALCFSVDPSPDLSRTFRLDPPKLMGLAATDPVRTFRTGRFVIHYVPSQVLSDAAWAKRLPRPTGNAVRGDVPDLVEDMGVALEQTCTALLALKGAGGDPVFKAPAVPVHVHVRNLGGDAGSSAVGGPIYLSTSRYDLRDGVSAWEDLTQVVAHELVHVLQNRYYLGGAPGNLWNFLGPGNHWFIEATANHYAAMACRPTPKVRRAFYLKDGYDDYLTRSLTANSEQSYYLVGSFLDYLASQYSKTLVHEAWKLKNSMDLANLDAALRARGEHGAVSAAFSKYCRWLMTHPDAEASMNGVLKGALAQRMGNVLKEASGEDNFSSRTAFLHFERRLEPLSAWYMSAKARIQGPALLVCDPGIGSTYTADVT